MPPGSPKSLAASRGVQWSRRAAVRPSAHCRPARTTPCASGRPDRTAWVFCVRAARTLPSYRAAPLVPAYSPPGTARRPPILKSANAPLPFGSLLDEGCERPPWRSRPPSRRRTQKFAPPRRPPGKASRETNRDCDTDIGLWVQATILPCGREHSFLPRAKPGTAFCHEIADFGLESPRPEPE